jgi:hypothetical protein
VKSTNYKAFHHVKETAFFFQKMEGKPDSMNADSIMMALNIDVMVKMTMTMTMTMMMMMMIITATINIIIKMMLIYIPVLT